MENLQKYESFFDDMDFSDKKLKTVHLKHKIKNIRVELKNQLTEFFGETLQNQDLKVGTGLGTVHVSLQNLSIINVEADLDFDSVELNVVPNKELKYNIPNLQTTFYGPTPSSKTIAFHLISKMLSNMDEFDKLLVNFFKKQDSYYNELFDLGNK